MAAKRLSPLTTSVLAFLSALAAWASTGALTIESGQAHPVRLGLLPSLRWLALSLLLALVVSMAAIPRRWDRLRLAALAVVLLAPWIPGVVLPAALVWTGPLRIWLWAFVAIGVAAPSIVRRFPQVALTVARNPQRAPWVAAAIAAALYLAAARSVFPQLPNGDEPHYLVIAQSILLDHDLKIENNHRRGDYRAYYDSPLDPDYLQRGVDGEVYSIHAPGLPAAVAVPLALGGYPGVVVCLALACAFGSAVAWIAAWRVTADSGAAWFGWASVALTAPFVFQSFVVYPDGLAAVLVTAAVLVLLDREPTASARLVWTGAALAVLPWLHTRYAMLSLVLAALIAARLWRGGDVVRRIGAFASVPIVSLMCWLGFFYDVYGTIDPRAPYGRYTQSAFANVPAGITGLLFDQQFGLLIAAPVFCCAILGFASLLRRSSRLAGELLMISVPYVLAVAAYQMWWGGTSSPARFIVPIVLPLAIPAAVWWQMHRSITARVAAMSALALSLFVTIVLAAVDHGALLYNSRDGASRLLLWLSPLVNLSTGLPSSFQRSTPAALVNAVVWTMALIATMAFGRAAERRGATSAGVALALGFGAVVAGSVALTVVWRLNAATVWMPQTGNVALLRNYDPDKPQVAIAYDLFHRARMREELPRLTLAEATTSPSSEEQTVRLAHVPAGIYALDATKGHEAGVVAVALNRDLPPAWQWPEAASGQIARREIHLAAPVTSLFVRSLHGAAFRLKPIEIAGSRSRFRGMEGSRGARYGPAVVFLVSGDAFMEPSGAWVAGGRSADFVVASDHPASLQLFVRNPPVGNLVTLEGDDWREFVVLRPGEERLVEVPILGDPRGIFLRVHSAASARPVEYEPGSTDRRVLGCWIEIR